MFILPATLILIGFFIYPVVKSFYLSTTHWGFVSGPPEFVGLANFVELLNSSEFRRSFWVTLYYVFGTTFFTVSLAFVIALALEASGRAKNVYKGIYFTPVVISTVIASVLWISVYHPYSGPMQLLPLPSALKSESWYQDPQLVMPGLILFTLWKGLGLYTVIFLTGLSNIPETYREAARIDGASGWQSLRRIIIPVLKPIFLFAIVICIVYTFQNFAIVYTSTKGGPNNASNILPILMFKYGFQFFEMGRASALAVVQFLVMFVFSYTQFRLFRSDI